MKPVLRCCWLLRQKGYHGPEFEVVSSARGLGRICGRGVKDGWGLRRPGPAGRPSRRSSASPRCPCSSSPSPTSPCSSSNTCPTCPPGCGPRTVGYRRRLRGGTDGQGRRRREADAVSAHPLAGGPHSGVALLAASEDPAGVAVPGKGAQGGGAGREQVDRIDLVLKRLDEQEERDKKMDLLLEKLEELERRMEVPNGRSGGD